MGGVGPLPGGALPLLGLGHARVEGVALAGRRQSAPGRFEPSRQLFGAGGGLVGGVDALLVAPAVALPGGEPAGRVEEQLLVGPGLAVELGALGGDLGAAGLGPAGGVERAQLLAHLPLQRAELVRPGLGQIGGQQRTGALAGRGRRVVLALGLRAQREGGGDEVGLAGPVEPVPYGGAAGPGGGKLVGAAAGVRVPALQLGEAALVVERDTGGGLPALGGGGGALRDGEALAGPGARDSGPLQDGLGEPGLPGAVVGQRPVARVRAVPGGLRHPLGERDQSLVTGPDLLFGGAAQLGKTLFDGGEAAGVEEPPEQLAARLGVGPQELGEVALRQQDDLAELLAAHTDELPDLLPHLLVGAAERLPDGVPRVVLAQPGLRLLGGEAGAALLRPVLLGPPGDLQPPFPDGQVEQDLGDGVGRGVVAAQGCAGALAGAGHRPVERVADGVQDGGLARAGRPVEQEEPGGRERVEVDFLGAAEGAEGGDAQPVQPHRAPRARGPG